MVVLFVIGTENFITELPPFVFFSIIIAIFFPIESWFDLPNFGTAIFITLQIIGLIIISLSIIKLPKPNLT